MEEFLSLAQSKLGLSSSDSSSATSALVGLLKDKMPSAEFGELAEKIPGLGNLADNASGSEGGGLLGGLASSAASMFGGSDSSLGSLQKLVTSGLSLGDAGSFAGLFASFIKDKGGDGLLAKVLSSVPELKKFIS